ncbi:hypothetical protein F5Y12DRAFT_517070 [Xylaria sp. FL1777]|nr:hypothetical protein F5Y12DRAFT_517070 [Xylaria sp. FL1777]
MARVTLREWLSSALPSQPFLHPELQSPTSENHRMYLSFSESIKVEKWEELGTLPALEHLAFEPDHPVGPPDVPILDIYRTLFAEGNIGRYFALTLFTRVNLALRTIYNPPVTIVHSVPFAHVTSRGKSIRPWRTYTPGYTIFKGDVKGGLRNFVAHHGNRNIGAFPEDLPLLTEHGASLIVGEVKLYREAVTRDHVDHTNALSRPALGQLLWYCVCRKARFGFCISDVELVLMEFVVKHNDNVVALSDVVARAESELSTPAQGVPSSELAASERRHSISTTGDAATKINNADSPPDSSPSLPNSILEEPDPQTLELEPTNFYSRDSNVPSNPGEISTQTLEDLISAGSNVAVRLYTFPFREIEQWASALFGFISLAQLVDARGNKDISSTPTSVRDFLAN